MLITLSLNSISTLGGSKFLFAGLLSGAHCKVGDILQALIDSLGCLLFVSGGLYGSGRFAAIIIATTWLNTVLITHSDLQVISFVVKLAEELIGVHLLSLGALLFSSVIELLSRLIESLLKLELFLCEFALEVLIFTHIFI